MGPEPRLWFGTGSFGPLIAVPITWQGWATVLGIAIPVAVFAGQQNGPMCLLSIGLFACPTPGGEERQITA